MNKRTFIVLCFAVTAGTMNLRAQTDKQSAEAKEKQELRQKFQRGMKARQMERAAGKSVTVENNRYNHREAEIQAKLSTDGIPADFPVYSTAYTNEQYTVLMNKWYAANPSLLKKETTNEQK